MGIFSPSPIERMPWQAGCEFAPDVELLLATLDLFLQSYFNVFSVPMLLEPHLPYHSIRPTSSRFVRPPMSLKLPRAPVNRPKVESVAAL